MTCTFLDPSSKTLMAVDVLVVTTLGPKSVPIRAACEEMCRTKGWRVWAQPSGVEGDDVWIVFRMKDRQAHFVKHFPSKAAAEMWVQLSG